jgi:uncharacterized protein (TIGR03435 family)
MTPVRGAAMLRRKWSVAAFTLAIFGVALGQSGTPLPTFDAASVKATPPERQGRLTMDYCSTGGRFLVAGTPVLWSLTYAFRVREYQVFGAPSWTGEFDSAYDIDARPAAPADNAQCRLIVQSLFADRFRLVTHREMKEASVYFLTVAKGGAKLHEGGLVRLNGSLEVGAAGSPVYPDGLTMSLLATRLSDIVGKPVLDRTGLDKKYGISLDYSRRDGDDRPSIFTAVQEQLGLRLDAGKAPIEMLVVDHIEKPGPN